MAWNDSGNGKGPWDKGDQEPVNLDEIVQNWQRTLSRLTGGGGGGGASAAGTYVLIILLLVVWGATGFYRVDQAERGVVQRFGEYTLTTLPGLRWHLPFPIEVRHSANDAFS